MCGSALIKGVQDFEAQEGNHPETFLSYHTLQTNKEDVKIKYPAKSSTGAKRKTKKCILYIFLNMVNMMRCFKEFKM